MFTQYRSFSSSQPTTYSTSTTYCTAQWLQLMRQDGDIHQSHLYRHEEASAHTQHVNSTRRLNLQSNEQRNSRIKEGSNNRSSSTKHAIYCTSTMFLCLQPREVNSPMASPHCVTTSRHLSCETTARILLKRSAITSEAATLRS